MTKVGKLRRQLTTCSIKSIPTDELDYYTVIEIKNHLTKMNKENEDAFDEEDFQKYVMDTKYLRRFIIKGSTEDSCKFISNILHWRKEEGLPKLTINSFPRECFTYDFFQIIDNDLDGNIVAIVRGQYFIKGPTTKEVAEKFICFMGYYMNDKLVQKGDEFGLTMVFDSTNISLAQYDMDFISFLIDLLTNKMPNNIRKVVLYDLPWYCMPLLKTVLLFIPDQWKKIIVHANSTTIRKHVSRECLPQYFKGSTRTEPIEKITTLEDKKPLRDMTAEELSQLGMKKEHMKDYENLLKIWNDMEAKMKKNKK